MQTFTLTVITVHLNDFAGLRNTHRSLERLLCEPTVQWVVVDGLSTPEDDKEQDLLDVARRDSDVFVSEPDEGIYDAMNKATGMASGEYLLYLNAGDLLHPDFNYSAVCSELEKNKPDMLWGCHDETGRKNSLKHIRPRSPSFLWWGMPVCHQATLFSRDILGAEPYDIQFKISADYDLLIKLYKNGIHPIASRRHICVSDTCGLSNLKLHQAFEEQALIRARHFGTPLIVSSVIALARRLISLIGKSAALRKLWK